MLYSFDTVKQHMHPSYLLLSPIFCTSLKFEDFQQCSYQKYAWASDLEHENPSQEPSTASIPERDPPITKATGISSHVLLLADMQRVINS